MHFVEHGTRKAWTEFFFLPERELPDLFYTTTDLHQSFERQEFNQYRIVMDRNLAWISRVGGIIDSNPRPRQAHPRPSRPSRLPDAQVEEADAQVEEADAQVEEDLQVTGNIGDVLKDPTDDGDAGTATSSSRNYSIVKHYHQRLFHAVMSECARRRSGLLIVLAHDHPSGDFAFCSYAWTTQEQTRYRLTGKAPKTATELPADTPLFPFYHFIHDHEASHHGPRLTLLQFQRLDSSPSRRLVLWSVWGSDELDRSSPILAITTSDIGPTKSQREFFSQREQSQLFHFGGRPPTTTALLNTGKTAAHYVIGNCGPLFYEEDYAVEKSVWKYLSSQCQAVATTASVSTSLLDAHSLTDLHCALLKCV